MSETRILKDEKEEYQLFRSRAIVAGLAVLFFLSIIGARLFYLQIVNHDHLTQLAQENYQKRIPIPPVRGQIYDRNGIVLADNKIEYVLEVVRDIAKDMDKNIAILQQPVSYTHLTLPTKA